MGISSILIRLNVQIGFNELNIFNKNVAVKYIKNAK
jgi:hypothetical protein